MSIHSYIYIFFPKNNPTKGCLGHNKDKGKITSLKKKKSETKLFSHVVS